VTATHILIVDADILVRTPLADYLRECGYQVIEAASVVEAQTLLQEKSALIDIVLADMGAGDQSGFALATWVRRHFTDIRVVLAGSVTASVEKAAGLCEEGPALSKPYDHRLVLEHIQRLRAGKKDNLT
jgi:DNA-binding response OmpR family regulator